MNEMFDVVHTLAKKSPKHHLNAIVRKVLCKYTSRIARQCFRIILLVRLNALEQTDGGPTHREFGYRQDEYMRVITYVFSHETFVHIAIYRIQNSYFPKILCERRKYKFLNCFYLYCINGTGIVPSIFFKYREMR